MTSSPLAVKVEITPLTPGIIDSFAKPFLFQISGSIVLAHPLVLQRLSSTKVQYILSSQSLRGVWFSEPSPSLAGCLRGFAAQKWSVWCGICASRIFHTTHSSGERRRREQAIVMGIRQATRGLQVLPRYKKEFL